ncbi:hypothetical protein DFA_01070 [Cavenderia fasciculata]|uniref:Uncharacterized protein n=1 Tax=Cavenderia fasciculata TaxID=261658 RepID=F4PQM8_CACFS|nr:uncharacterized protein DFA_01070 [Cavenderia fasciculata]EGG21195.1 hypothetical protein DFA_01070 [Cavenderia fasciculata]|eukprot:XP_004359045.1 hypothetical protein DFA_01070 [Cavenderia fasciculata]
MTDISKKNNNNLPLKEEEEEDGGNEISFGEMSRADLISTIREIRTEYFDLKDRYKGIKGKIGDKEKDIQFQRKLLTEREDLLLQLQWEENQDINYLQQVGATDDDSKARQVKMKALLDQMRVMEQGIFDRDYKIKQLEKTIENITLKQIDRPTGSLAVVVDGATSNPQLLQQKMDEENPLGRSHLIDPSIITLEGKVLETEIKRSISEYPLPPLKIPTPQLGKIVPVEETYSTATISSPAPATISSASSTPATTPSLWRGISSWFSTPIQSNGTITIPLDPNSTDDNNTTSNNNNNIIINTTSATTVTSDASSSTSSSSISSSNS